MTEAGRTTWTT